MRRYARFATEVTPRPEHCVKTRHRANRPRHRLGPPSICPAIGAPKTADMPKPRTNEVSELALTATLLSLYVGARGTARALGVVRSLMR
jgi:hypothetical protein